jgi:hypothetical protein
VKRKKLQNNIYGMTNLCIKIISLKRHNQERYIVPRGKNFKKDCGIPGEMSGGSFACFSIFFFLHYCKFAMNVLSHIDF